MDELQRARENHLAHTQAQSKPPPGFLAHAASELAALTAHAASKMQLVGFGFPDYECFAHLGVTEDGRLAVLLLPRSAP